jgi:hypothetical protein
VLEQMRETASVGRVERGREDMVKKANDKDEGGVAQTRARMRANRFGYHLSSTQCHQVTARGIVAEVFDLPNRKTQPPRHTFDTR